MNAASPEQRTFAQHYRNLQTSLDPGTVVAIAYSEKLLTQYEHSEATYMHRSDSERLEIFLNALKRRIAENPDAFHTFVHKVLEEEPPFHSLAEKLKTASHHKVLSISANFAIENRQAINGKFADLLTSVCYKMLRNGVDIGEFRLFVLALFEPGDCIPPLPTSVTQVFEAITHHGLWNSLHYSPLVQIVRKFGAGDPEMKAWIQKYKKDLKAYTIVASIEDFIESDLDTCTYQSQVDSVKYDPRYNTPVEWKTDLVDHSLQHLIDVWELFSDNYLMPESPPTALLDRVRKGCVSVTWLVPSYLIPQLVRVVEVDTEFLQRYRILKVTVRGKVVYEEERAGKSTDKTPVVAMSKAVEDVAHFSKEGEDQKLVKGMEHAKELEPAAASNFQSAPTGGEQCHDRPIVAVHREEFGGYDCKFIEPPPRVYPVKCPICHLKLRDPYESICCGYNFCYTCSQQVQRKKLPCPLCRKEIFEVKENKSMKRSLNQLKVFCTHSKVGCRWTGELGKLQAHLDETDHSNYERPDNKSPPCEEDNTSTMEWKQKVSLPVEMNSHHIVRIGNNIYCGGGFTGKVSTDRLVFKYDYKEEEWSKLPICPSLHFGLTQLDEKLVTVGGRDIDELTPIKDIYIFEEDCHTWENFSKPLSIARCSPCVVAYKSVLVVSGGIVNWKFDYEHPGRTKTVEVFQDSQWHASVPLPFELSSMSCAIINGTCYIVGGKTEGGLPNRRVCFISVSSLIHPESSGKHSPSSPKWEHRNCPLFSSIAAELEGHLLAIGGKDTSNHSSAAVHKYSPSTNSWEAITNGSLPKPKFKAAAISLEGGDIIIVGGKDKPGSMDTTVYIGSKRIEQ